MIDRIKDEPVIVAAFVQAVLALIVAFGIPLTDEQVAAILGVTAAALAFIVRRKVVPRRHI